LEHVFQSFFSSKRKRKKGIWGREKKPSRHLTLGINKMPKKYQITIRPLLDDRLRQEAATFLDQVKVVFKNNNEKYSEFLQVMKISRIKKQVSLKWGLSCLKDMLIYFWNSTTSWQKDIYYQNKLP
jgi:hypothetical protein